MRIVGILFAALGLAPSAPAVMQEPVAFDEAIDLDAEDLAEQGIIEAYDRIDPVLESMGITPAPIRAVVDAEQGRYAIEFAGKTFLIADRGIDEAQSWGNAAAVFFEIVNAQLGGTGKHLYAIGHGNGLAGVFLSDAEFARAQLSRKPSDRPYLPTRQAPWFGMPHD